MDDFKRRFLIKKVENEIAKARDISVLIAHQGNIHSLMPNEFTQLVDVFTPTDKPDTKIK